MCIRDSYKKEIRFTYASSARRNIDKALVRSLPRIARELREEILAEYEACGIYKVKYDQLIVALDQLKILEKDKKYMKDYAKTINYMVSGLAQRIILRKCLESKRASIETSYSQKIKSKNKEMYKVTLDDYLDYINSF
eukprot:TRINITY_DN14343_c0_g1_i6.p1 TRINITY_DN14343_c0_g1~~TRINITY_DN14343_c0_g1_i6.p1  ORF type:complete len:138 (+),score=30.60 TRINITY_DN14343_c0_g1_i6:73-486(+)